MNEKLLYNTVPFIRFTVVDNAIVKPELEVKYDTEKLRKEMEEKSKES